MCIAIQHMRRLSLQALLTQNLDIIFHDFILNFKHKQEHLFRHVKMTTQRTPFDDFYEVAKNRGRNHQSAFIYAAQKYVEIVFEKKSLIACDDHLQGDLAEHAFRKYSKEQNRGHSHQISWNMTSAWIREQVAIMDDRERKESSTRRPAGAFDSFDNMHDTLPSRGTSTRHPKPCEYENVPNNGRGSLFEEDVRHRRAQAHSIWFPRDEPSPRRQPPVPEGRGKYNSPAPKYASDRKDYERPAPPRPAGPGKYHFPEPEYPIGPRAPPPMPTGKGKYKFPEPEYPSGSRPRAQPRYEHADEGYDSGRGYNARTYRPRHAESRARSPSPEPYRYSRRPRYETREPSSSSSQPRPRPRHETREPHSSSQRPRSPPPAADDLCLDPKPTTCFYVVLGIERSASDDEVKEAYRKMSLKHHPDRAGPNAKTVATNKMAEINQANDVLSDAIQRHYYNETGRYKSR